MTASLTEEELRELERWADEFDEYARDPEANELAAVVRYRLGRLCRLSKKAAQALTATAEPTAGEER